MTLPEEGMRMRAVYDIVASEGPLNGKTVATFCRQVGTPNCGYSLRALVRRGLVIREAGHQFSHRMYGMPVYRYRIASATNEDG